MSRQTSELVYIQSDLKSAPNKLTKLVAKLGSFARKTTTKLINSVEFFVRRTLVLVVNNEAFVQIGFVRSFRVKLIAAIKTRMICIISIAVTATFCCARYNMKITSKLTLGKLIQLFPFPQMTRCS